jgi:hypothetical protein
MTGIREITKEQFSDGTTIDGNRIDRAMGDVVGRVNHIQKKDMKRRWVQTQFVGGYTPQDPTSTSGTEISAPWLAGRNDGVSSVHNFYISDVRSEYRFKSSDVDTVVGGDQFVMTNAFYFRKPIIITGLSVCMLTDAVYANTHNYTDDYDDHTSGDPANDLVVNIEVDNPFLPENRALSSVVYHRGGFKVTSQNFRGIPAAPTLDMDPLHPGGHIQGIFMDDQDLNIPISRDSRVRFGVLIPNTTKTKWLHGETPWFGQCYSWTLTILESTEE